MNAMQCAQAATALVLLGLLAAPAGIAAGCAGRDACAETRSFVAAITSFRESKAGRNRVLTATVRFENKTKKPLTLGYVRNSGVALDDLGNRYVVPGAHAVRAIGEISGAGFDPKFTLEPGEGSDARFELVWDPGKAIVGTSYELELAVREIVPVAADQFRLAQEHALRFAGLGPASAKTGAAAPAKAASAAPAGAAAAAPVAAATPAVAADPCGGSPRCYHAGTFVAEVLQVSPSSMKGARHQTVSLNVRFRNVSDKPVILAYSSQSSAAIDNFGNRYTWGRPGTHDTSVKGIGQVSSRKADPQFRLEPGQSRSATFGITRFSAVPPIGESWSYDVVIEELELLPGQQIRSVRQNSLNFANLAAGTFTGLPGPAAVDALGNAVPADATDAASKVIDLFNKIRKK